MTRREQLIKDENDIKRILSECKYLHLGLIDDGKPYVVAMNYGVDFDKEDGHLILYLHSAANSGKLAMVEKNSSCAFSMECNIQPFEGKLACQYGVAYESIMGSGRITIVEDSDERAHALVKLMETQTDKNDFEFNERMISIVGIMKIEAIEMTVKRRILPTGLEIRQ